MFIGKFFLRAAKLLAAAAVGLGLAASNVSASDVYLGTISTSPTTVTVPHSGGSFTDRIEFALGALGGVGSSATPINVSFGSFDILDLAFTAGTLYAGSIATPGSAVGSFSSGVGGVLSFSGSLSPFTTYFAQLTGVTTGAAGGQYAFAIAAVPEAGQWLMLLAGLAMLGVMVRRRAN